MNLLLLAGLVIALLAVIVYVSVAAQKNKRPELVDGIVVFVGAVSVLGAIRLIGFVFTGQFAQVTSAPHNGSLWSLSSEDAVFVVIGGIALAWVSVQTIWESFTKVIK
ncbi:MAG TPA: hypothetical protein VKK31_14030 [Thermoanaerobaculia bacterium]|nr:hypothetical protein [Thermoanaerobaculia bacterium]